MDIQQTTSRKNMRTGTHMATILSTYFRLAGGLPLLSLMFSARAVEPTSVLIPSNDGAYIVDTQTKQVWPRCVEGMQWNGKTCTGEPLLLTHAEAIELATIRRKADAADWHLPRVTELQRLTRNSANHQGLDPLLFPAAPGQWHWASTANVRSNAGSINQYNYGNIAQGRTASNSNQMAFLHGWAVNLTTGKASGDFKKSTALPVRLVRSQNF